MPNLSTADAAALIQNALAEVHAGYASLNSVHTIAEHALINTVLRDVAVTMNTHLTKYDTSFTDRISYHD
jgi:hypothetical protein